MIAFFRGKRISGVEIIKFSLQWFDSGKIKNIIYMFNKNSRFVFSIYVSANYTEKIAAPRIYMNIACEWLRRCGLCY